MLTTTITITTASTVGGTTTTTTTTPLTSTNTITTVQLVFHTRMVQQKCLPVKRSGARRRQGVLQQPLKGTLLDNHGIPRGFGGQYLWPVHMDCQGSTPSA